MDWMYKEHARNEESSPDVNNRSPLCDSLTKLEDKDFTVVNETEDRVDHFEDKITSQTDLDAENEEGDAEDSSIIVGPITSDLDELTAKAMDSKQPGREKDVDELLCVSSDILFQVQSQEFLFEGGQVAALIYLSRQSPHTYIHIYIHIYTHTHTYIYIYTHTFLFDKLYIYTHPIKTKTKTKFNIINQNYV